MPYIKEKRKVFNTVIYDLCSRLSNNNAVWGELNYIISKLLYIVVYKVHRKCYFTFMCAMGTLVCVMFEFYRRWIAPYEDEKKEENGDIDS